MIRSSMRAFGLLAIAAGLIGCSSNSGDPLFVPHDAGLEAGGRGAFLQACATHTDCESGLCLPMLSGKRCSRLCDATNLCPTLTGWSCSGESTCVCTGTGAMPNVCNVDGDCDGKPDKLSQPEVCNGEDDDCNGTPDDVAPGATGAKVYFPDTDKDGFGDPKNPLWTCSAPPAGYLENSSDCDDARADVNPSMTEICGDDVDHDCDGKTWDVDVCGYLPPWYEDLNGPNALSATIKVCDATAGIPSNLDIIDIVAKQDRDYIKFTVRLTEGPTSASCSSYILRLGNVGKVYPMAYIYRPARAACGTLPELEANLKGSRVPTKTVVAALASAPGHVSFTVPKDEYLASLSSPSYYLKACTNATASADKDVTDCVTDSCETPIRRE